MTVKIGRDEAEKRLFETHGNKIKLLEYERMGAKAHFLCNVCGNDWWCVACSTIVSGTGCRNCSYKVIAASQNADIGEISEYLSMRGCKLRSNSYLNNHTPIKIQFICGHVQSMTIATFRGRYDEYETCFCRKCQKKKASAKLRLPLDDVREYIASQGCELLSSEYINMRSKIDIRLECGHIASMSFGSFKKGSRCKICSSKLHGKKCRRPLTDIYKKLDENNLKLISVNGEYVGGNSYIKYSCIHGHITRRRIQGFFIHPTCGECKKIACDLAKMGSGGSGWKGGVTTIHKNIRVHINEWKEKSAASCEYLCVITGRNMGHIHHLYGMNLIIEDALDELGFAKVKQVKDFTDEEWIFLIEKIKEIHNRHPLGVCLTKGVHRLFHKLYGTGNNTPDQFYEFTERIQSGEIKVRKKKQ